MSTWNTEPPEDLQPVLLKDEYNQYLVAIWLGGVWEPTNVQANFNADIEHALMGTIVWQELQE